MGWKRRPRNEDGGQSLAFFAAEVIRRQPVSRQLVGERPEGVVGVSWKGGTGAAALPCWPDEQRHKTAQKVQHEKFKGLLSTFLRLCSF